jgi:ABC-type dipeptide/oligopeptide/nickel transport system ATPase subunit
MIQPTSGRVLFEGKDIAHMSKSEFKNYRRAVQIIHQDPYASLNPVHTVGDTLCAPLLHHKLVKGRREATQRAGELLELVDCRPVENFIDKFPHQLSGGQRQRISIARAMTLNPRVIIADESVSMVDVSIRVSLLNTLLKLRNDLGVTFLFITHDLAVVKYFGWEGRVGVMYVGKLIEYGRTPQLIPTPVPWLRRFQRPIPTSLARSGNCICAVSTSPISATCRRGACSIHGVPIGSRVCATSRSHRSPILATTAWWHVMWWCGISHRAETESPPSMTTSAIGPPIDCHSSFVGITADPRRFRLRPRSNPALATGEMPTAAIDPRDDAAAKRRREFFTQCV